MGRVRTILKGCYEDETGEYVQSTGTGLVHHSNPYVNITTQSWAELWSLAKETSNKRASCAFFLLCVFIFWRPRGLSQSQDEAGKWRPLGHRKLVGNHKGLFFTHQNENFFRPSVNAARGYPFLFLMKLWYLCFSSLSVCLPVSGYSPLDEHHGSFSWLWNLSELWARGLIKLHLWMSHHYHNKGSLITVESHRLIIT